MTVRSCKWQAVISKPFIQPEKKTLVHSYKTKIDRNVIHNKIQDRVKFVFDRLLIMEKVDKLIYY